MRSLWLAVLCCVLTVGSAWAADKFTYVDLVNRLIDMEAPAVLPAKGERGLQWSSYDRASRHDAASGRYVGWDNNDDGNGFIRKEGDQIVMAEMEGPGCIWRIWSASAKAGHVKIYLDGSMEPAIDLPFSGYFDHQNPPFIYPTLVYDASSGKNCYIPIPYQKSCKIVADEGWGRYFHFGYTTFPKGTQVPTFKRELSAEEKAALEAVDKYLSTGLGTDPAGERKGEKIVTRKLDLQPGKKASIKINGPRAITAIEVKVDPALVAANPDLLRQVTLEISWGAETTPSVWAPLIDFFGTAPNANNYKSLPSGVTEEGFYSFWYMPFTSQADLVFANDGAQPFPMEVSVTVAPLTKRAKDLGRFHAKWHRDAFVPMDSDRWLDWTLLKTVGHGRFCGVAMHLWVPTGGWWGEGDEKFFVDGEMFPSVFGTGSEDYFGYAWGNPALFQKAFHNQTRSDNNAGHVALNRWQIADNIPFQESFVGHIEKYRSNMRPALYSCTAYWYQSERGIDPYVALPVGDRVGYCVIPAITTFEGEKLHVEKKTGGEADQRHVNGRWTEGSNFEWWDAKPGDELTQVLPVAKAGRYKMVFRFTKAPSYGRVQLLLDGEPLGEPVALNAPVLIPGDESPVGSATLAAGDHKLVVRMLESPDSRLTKFGFGFDYVKLVPEE